MKTSILILLLAGLSVIRAETYTITRDNTVIKCQVGISQVTVITSKSTNTMTATEFCRYRDSLQLMGWHVNFPSPPVYKPFVLTQTDVERIQGQIARAKQRAAEYEDRKLEAEMQAFSRACYAAQWKQEHTYQVTGGGRLTDGSTYETGKIGNTRITTYSDGTSTSSWSK